MEIRMTEEHFESDMRLASREAKRARDQKQYGPGVDTVEAILDEVERAKRHGTTFASLHEGYAVILEELDEVWDITRQKRCERDELELRKEFIQIAAMAIKAIESMPNFIGGSV